MNNVFYHSSESMNEIKDGSIKLIVTHPPFLNWGLGVYGDMINRVFYECYRVLEDGGVLVCVNTDVKKLDFFSKHIFLHDLLIKNGFVLRDEKIWVRTENNRYDRMGFSFVQIFSKGKYKKIEINKEFEAGIWSLPFSMNVGDFRDAFHPDIPKRCIGVFTKKGDLILDPFLGSGTTYKVAKGEGRVCYGYELNLGLKPLIEDTLPQTTLQWIKK